MDSFKLLIWDISELIKQFSWRDLTSSIPFFWVTILYFIPLKKIDGRHEVSFFTFSVLFVTIGLTLFVPLHNIYERTNRSPITIAMFAILLLLLAFYKWSRLIPSISIKKEEK